MSVVYEVNLQIDAAIERDYRAWLNEHVGAMLQLPGFIGARIYDVLPDGAGADRVGFCVHYSLRDEAALQSYLQRHAAQMRADGEARFGQRFSASRRVLRPHRSEA